MKLGKIRIISKYKVEVETNDVTMEITANNDKNIGYDFYMNGIKKEFDLDMEIEIIDYVTTNIDKSELSYVIANDNYKNIFNIFNLVELKSYYQNDIKKLTSELNETLNIFIKQEHYEKCETIKQILNEIYTSNKI